jgi:hypothetical protein
MRGINMNLPFGWVIIKKKHLLSGEPDRKPSIPQAKVKRFNALTGATERDVGQPSLAGLGGRKSKDNLNTLDGTSFWQSFAIKKKNTSIGLEAKLDLTDFSSLAWTA